MHLDLVYHPREIVGKDLSNVCCVVLDVLRATTTMSNAIANGAAAIHVFAELEEARTAHANFNGPRLLVGERGCLRPEGFDLGNSPGAAVKSRVEGHTLFMSTTNGTRAIHACSCARKTLIAALVNASATSRTLRKCRCDVIFVCAGVDGAPGGEDVDAAATIADMLCLLDTTITVSESMRMEMLAASWLKSGIDPKRRLFDAPGGVNLLRVGLDRDIEFASQLDLLDCACEVDYDSTGAAVRLLT